MLGKVVPAALTELPFRRIIEYKRKISIKQLFIDFRIQLTPKLVAASSVKRVFVKKPLPKSVKVS
jgi:hypothetical protein